MHANPRVTWYNIRYYVGLGEQSAPGVLFSTGEELRADRHWLPVNSVKFTLIEPRPYTCYAANKNTLPLFNFGSFTIDAIAEYLLYLARPQYFVGSLKRCRLTPVQQQLQTWVCILVTSHPYRSTCLLLTLAIQGGAKNAFVGYLTSNNLMCQGIVLEPSSL